MPVDPRDTTDPGQLRPGAMQQTGELHARTMTSGATNARQGAPRKLTERDRRAGPIAQPPSASGSVGEAGDDDPGNHHDTPDNRVPPTSSVSSTAPMVVDHTG